MSDQNTPEKPSKSARKRQIEALRVLAEQMAGLGEAELTRLGVEPELREALALVRPMRPSGARNRQLKYCLRFMQGEDLAEVRAYLEDRQSQRVSANRVFHEVECWRDRLIAEGDAALSALLDERPDLDRQQLRQLSRDAIRERDSGKPAGAGRRLFRYLRDRLEAANEKN